MNLRQSLEHWKAALSWLQAVDAWVDGGKPQAPSSLSPVLSAYQRLTRKEAKAALKLAREELSRDAFIRMFSAFEAEFRPTFCAWMHKKFGSQGSKIAEIHEALPESIRSVLKIASALEPRFAPRMSGYAANVMDCRNKLVHGGFAAPMSYDLEEVHRQLFEIVALFASPEA